MRLEIAVNHVSETGLVAGADAAADNLGHLLPMAVAHALVADGHDERHVRLEVRHALLHRVGEQQQLLVLVVHLAELERGTEHGVHLCLHLLRIKLNHGAVIPASQVVLRIKDGAEEHFKRLNVHQPLCHRGIHGGIPPENLLLLVDELELVLELLKRLLHGDDLLQVVSDLLRVTAVAVRHDFFDSSVDILLEARLPCLELLLLLLLGDVDFILGLFDDGPQLGRPLVHVGAVVVVLAPDLLAHVKEKVHALRHAIRPNLSGITVTDIIVLFPLVRIVGIESVRGPSRRPRSMIREHVL